MAAMLQVLYTRGWRSCKEHMILNVRLSPPTCSLPRASGLNSTHCFMTTPPSSDSSGEQAR
jgi:hypothetical protein